MPEHPSIQRIRAVLARVRRSIERQALKEGLVVGATAVLAVLVAGIGVLAWTGVSSGWWVWALAVLVFAAAVRRLYGRTQARFEDDEAVGAYVESQAPAWRSDIRAALELGAGNAPAPSREAAVLRERLVRRVETGLGDAVDGLSSMAPRRDLYPARVVAVLAVFVAGALWVASPSHFKHGARRLFVSADAESRAENRAPEMRPVVSTLDLRLVPPAHTQLPAREIMGSTGDIVAISGTEVFIAGRALDPVESATLLIRSGGEEERYALEVADSSQLSGQFMVRESGAYTFEVQLRDGSVVTDPVPRRMMITPDSPPRIELLEPTANLEVSPGDLIDFSYVISDDFGISEVNLAWHFQIDNAAVELLPLHGRIEGLSVEDTVPFDTAPMNLQPRDEIVVYLEATDNDTLGGPKTSRSRPISLSVSAPEELNREILRLEEELFEELIKQLGQMLGNSMNTWASDDGETLVATPLAVEPAGAAAIVRAQAPIHEDWPSILAKYRELMDMVGRDELTIDRDRILLQGGLDRLYEQERDEARLLERILPETDESPVPVRDFLRLAEHNSGHVQDTERVTLMLEDLIASQKEESIARALEELSDIRDRLRELMEEYRDTQDPYLREQIERELARLAERMQELLERLADQMQDMPWEHMNRDAFEQSDTMENVQNMRDSFQEIRDMLDNNDIESALSALEQLEQGLDQLMNEFNADSGGESGELSEFDQQMAEMMDELTALEEQEQAIEEETSELLEEWRRERMEEIREEMQQRMQSALRRVRESRENLVAQERDRLSPATRDHMEDGESALEQLERRLESNDVAGSMEQAMRAVAELNDAEQALDRAERYMQHDEAGQQQATRSGDAAGDGRRVSEEVAEEMEELMQMAQPQPGSRQRGQMQEMAQRQQQVQQQMGEFQQQMNELGEQFPMMGQQFGEPLRQANNGMQQSQQGLQGGQPQPAQQGQQQALQGLRSMRQQMQQMMAQRRRQQQGRRGQQGQQGENGRDVNTDRVEIPDEGANGRARYRRQVMDAMREGSLDSYDDQIRSYYESLVE